MTIAEKLLAPFRRGGGGVPELAAQGRRTAALPSIFRTRTVGSDALPKRTPENLRRFAELPVARKAINTIKDRIAGMRWRVEARGGAELSPELAERLEAATRMFEQPNPDDSFRSMCEQVLEDIIVGGFGAIEIQRSTNYDLRIANGKAKATARSTPPIGTFAAEVAGAAEGERHALGDAARAPLQLWPVDGATIRLKADWNGDPEAARYVQETRVGGEALTLADRELSYIRLNPRTHTPFGLGRLEVAFETIHEFLGAHRFAAKLASNSVVQFALWMQELDAAQHERLIRWWQDEIEGTGKVPILSAESKPEVLRFGGGTDADLRLQWQEFLLRVIAMSFDLPPLLLGVEADVNRSTAAELTDAAFRTAVVPTAKLLAEHLTRDVLQKGLGWDDLVFVFADVDAPNELEQAQLHEILLRSGVLTVDEVRKMRGLGPR